MAEQATPVLKVLDHVHHFTAGDTDAREFVTDVLVELLHVSEEHDLDLVQLYASAQTHFRAERLEQTREAHGFA